MGMEPRNILYWLKVWRDEHTVNTGILEALAQTAFLSFVWQLNIENVKFFSWHLRSETHHKQQTFIYNVQLFSPLYIFKIS